MRDLIRYPYLDLDVKVATADSLEVGRCPMSARRRGTQRRHHKDAQWRRDNSQVNMRAGEGSDEGAMCSPLVIVAAVVLHDGPPLTVAWREEERVRGGEKGEQRGE